MYERKGIFFLSRTQKNQGLKGRPAGAIILPAMIVIEIAYGPLNEFSNDPESR